MLSYSKHFQNTCQGQHELHKLNVVRIKTQQITNTASTFFYKKICT